MKKIFLITVAVILLLVVFIRPGKTSGSILPANLLTLIDAEKILGEPAGLSDSVTKQEAKSVTYLCSYKADKEDTTVHRTGIIYFLYEDYMDVASARERYTFIHDANKKHGIEEIDNLGDEAYFHTDKTNFYFIMVRKGHRMFNMKVNKITSRTSLDAFRSTAAKITAEL